VRLTAIGMQGLSLIARKGLLAFSFLLIARKLGPQLFGQYTYAFTIAYMFYALASLGFSPVTTREIVRAPKAAGQLLKASMLIRVCSAVAAALLLSAIQFLPSFSKIPDTAKSVALLAPLIPAYAILDQFGAYVMGFNQNGKFAAVNIIQWASFATATIVTLSLGTRLSGVIQGQVWGMWLGVVLVCFLLRDSVRNAGLALVPAGMSLRLLKEAIPLAITAVLGIIYFRIGTLLLFRYAGAHETGLFTSSLQFIEASQLIPMAIMGAMFPVLCSHIADQKLLSKEFGKITSLILFISLFLATTGTVLSTTIMRFVFGVNFSSGGVLLRLLIWDVVPNYLAYALAYFLIAMNKQSLLTISGSLGVAMSVILNRFLIPSQGAMGAVYSSVLTESGVCILCLIFVLRYIRIDLPLRLAPISIGGAFIVLILGTVWETQINATVPRAIGFGCLSLVLFALGFVLSRSLATRIEAA
jgi:O-antigen/teichoic acid export membrane protein